MKKVVIRKVQAIKLSSIAHPLYANKDCIINPF